MSVYVEVAVNKFREIMESKEKNMLDSIDRGNKGELFLLIFLSRCDSAVLPSELSAALQSSTARISALLSALEKKGQVEREIDKNNRRNILVTITESGRKRAEDEIKRLEEPLAKLFTEMGEKDTFEYLRLLEKFFKLAQKYLAEAIAADEQ